MSLTKVNYEYDETHISSQNLNDIQDTIIEIDERTDVLVNTTSDNIDLDTLTTSNRYINGTASHCPTGYTGYAHVITYRAPNETKGIQFFYPYSTSSKIWFFRKYSSGWGSWICNGYIAGNTVSISPNTLQFAGVAQNTRTIRFTIPLTKEIFASNASITGQLGTRCNGVWSNSFPVTDATQTCIVSPCGVNVILEFATAQSFLTQNHAVIVQPSEMVITFS